VLDALVHVPQLDDRRALLEDGDRLAVLVPCEVEALPARGKRAASGRALARCIGTRRVRAHPVPSIGISVASSPWRLKMFTMRFWPHVARKVPCHTRAAPQRAGSRRTVAEGGGGGGGARLRVPREEH